MEVSSKPSEEVLEREVVEITFAPKPTEEAPTSETVEITFAPEPVEELPGRDTVEITFAPKPTVEAPKPVLTEVTLAPKPIDEAPSDVAGMEMTPTPTLRPTSKWEAPEDLEIVIERFEPALDEEAPEVVATTIELERAPIAPFTEILFEIKPEVPDEVTTSVEVTSIVREEGILTILSCHNHMHV